MGLVLEAERARLTVRLQAALEEVEPDLRHAGARLPQRLGKPESTALADCFTDLTLLYPVLIGEGLAPSSLEQARDFLVPHALLAIYAYLDDRRRDGQIQIESVEGRLAEWLVDEARWQLHDAMGRSANRQAIEDLLSVYAEAQAARASHPDRLPSLIVRRHLPGIVSAMAFLDASHCKRAGIERMGAGYRHLVLSLQWIDDLRDLEEDLATGADNLLLCHLPQSIRAEACLPDAICSLHAMRLFETALTEALRHVSAAREIASLLGCHTLARLLEPRQRWISDCERAYLTSARPPPSLSAADLRDQAPGDLSGVRKRSVRSPDP